METRFVLPLAVAIALHAFVFFGVTWQHPLLDDLVAKKPTIMVAPQPIPVVLEPPDRDDIDSYAPQPKGAVDQAMTQLERLSPTASVFEQPPRPQMASHTKITNIIPMTSMGLPDGEGDRVEWTGGSIFRIGELDNTPRTRSRIAPTYPAAERNAGIPGEVLVEFTVDESGRVLDPRVVRSSHVAFESPTLRAVQKWRFEPGRKNGQAVRFRMMVPVTFKLEE